MIVIAERINATRKRINKAVAERDAAFIAREARGQAEAGAHYIDVNAGRDPAAEQDDLKWLIETVQKAVDLPLCIDSASAKALAAGLTTVSKTPIINSVTAEDAKIREILPLAREHNALVVGLCLGGGGMPSGAASRIAEAVRIRRAAEEYGIPVERLFFDPLIVPLSTNPEDALAAAEAVRQIMKEFPGCHTTCGLSNISFGLPQRNTINRTYLAMLMAHGLDAVIMDPTEPHMMSTALAGWALAGRDEWCMEYIRAGREDRLD